MFKFSIPTIQKFIRFYLITVLRLDFNLERVYELFKFLCIKISFLHVKHYLYTTFALYKLKEINIFFV